MIERAELVGIPVSLIATAYVVLPGDERVEVGLKVGRSAFGEPILKIDWTAALDVIKERELYG